MARYLRLKNPGAYFVDPQTGLSITLDEWVPYPPTIGSLTKKWIQGGGLVIEEKEEVNEIQEEEKEIEVETEKIETTKKVKYTGRTRK